MLTKFKILPTVTEESLESWIWASHINIPNGFIIIKNPENSKSVKTFKRTIDKNFERIYNEKNTCKIDIAKNNNYLIINEFYRNVLKIRKHDEIDYSGQIEPLFRRKLSHPF